MTAATQPTPTAAPAKPSSKSPKPAKPSKPASKKAAAPGQSASISAGQRLLDAKGLSARGRALAQKLAKDRPTSRKELVALRDAVKASAAALREAKKEKDARVLATLNRAVRRLERAAR